MDNIERTNQVYYELYCNKLGAIQIQEPQGWENDTQGLEREKDSKAVLVKTEIALEFYGAAAEYISTVFYSFGINERILLSRHEKDLLSLAEKWKLRYVQQLDLKTFKQDSRTGKVTVKATEGGLYEDVKNRVSDDYDILTNESADGIDVGELNYNFFQPKPRGIFIESYLKDTRANYPISTVSYELSDSYVVRTIPLEQVYLSDEDVMTPHYASDAYDNLPNHTPTSTGEGDQDLEHNRFFEQAVQDKTVRVRMRLQFNVSEFYERWTADAKMWVAFRIGKLDESGDNVLKSSEYLTSNEGVTEFDPQTNRQTHTYDFDRVVELKEGESMSFVFASYYAINSNIGTGDTAKTVTYLNVPESWVKVEDQTNYDISTGKCLKPYDLFDRLLAKITGKTGLLRSSIFGQGGEYEHFIVDNGFWARGFPDSITTEEGEEERIQFKTSFKDAFESFCYLEPLCWFVAVEGNQQVLRIEKATYTMNNFVGIDLGAVDEIEHEASEPDFFSKVELGHDGSLEYEEINGLDEPNGLSNFSTHVGKSNDSTYSVISKYRVDSVGYELIRRKPYENFPKEDTSRDKDIWIHDAKIIHRYGSSGKLVYSHNLWNDSVNGEQLFDQAPKGIFDPDSAWNLRLSPMNRLLFGHGYSIKRGLYHYPENEIRFSSSNANQNLKTYRGITLAESGSLKINQIPKPKVEASKTKVTFKMTQHIENQFTGQTKVNGEMIPNYFGLIRYLEKGQERFGRIEKLSGQDKVTLTMINARL